MAVTVRIPTTLRPMAGGSSQVQVAGATLSEVLENLEAAHPGFRDRLLDESGALRKPSGASSANTRKPRR